MSTVDQLLERLALQPHPEGGFYRQTWQSATRNADGRALASSILFLLPTGVRSHWHRTDGEEIWIHQAGAPLALHIAEHGQVNTHIVSIEQADPGYKIKLNRGAPRLQPMTRDSYRRRSCLEVDCYRALSEGESPCS